VKRITRRVLLAVLGVVCLLTPYTVLLGVALLVAEALAIWLPHTFPGTAARIFRESEVLQAHVTYGVNDTGLSVEAPGLAAQAGWKYLRNWRVRDGWLILPCEGIPTVYLLVEALQAAGVYEPVLALAKAHGTAFDAPR
jgi:hypothetical protein